MKRWEWEIEVTNQKAGWATDWRSPRIGIPAGVCRLQLPPWHFGKGENGKRIKSLLWDVRPITSLSIAHGLNRQNQAGITILAISQRFCQLCFLIGQFQSPFHPFLRNGRSGCSGGRPIGSSTALSLLGGCESIIGEFQEPYGYYIVLYR